MAATNSPRTLDALLANRSWVRRMDPFPHVVAEDVFVEDVADEISAQILKIFGDDDEVSHFGWYDAWSWGFRKNLAWPLSIFISPEWRDLIAAAAGVRVNGYVSGGLHNHRVNSAPGYVHNDFSPVWFADPLPKGKQVRLPRGNVVNHMNGTIMKEGAPSYRTVRAVALLYYAGNEEWRPGDGGETGLYLRHSDPVERPGARVPPRNNSMVFFECLPGSYHTFLTNNRIERNAVVMWLHRNESDAVERFGDHAFAAPPPSS